MMPFEIAMQSDHGGADFLQAPAGSCLELKAKEFSNLFVDKKLLFDGISQLGSNKPSLSLKESQLSGMAVVLAGL